MEVLIVDDDIATVDVIKNTVEWEKLGVFRVYTAYNIKDAKSVIREEKIDIIISDIEMPQGSGIDLLEWYRKEGYEGEFLLLTCHESFDYATHAMKLRAFEYLLKPFEVSVMEATLKKMIRDVKEKQNLKETSEYGKWVKENKRQVYSNFWANIFSGRIQGDSENVAKMVKERHLEIDPKQRYSLVVSKISELQKDKEKYTPGLLFFVLENINMEIICGDPMKNNVYSIGTANDYYVISICPLNSGDESKEYENIKGKCEKLIEEHRKLLSSNITCCISKQTEITDFYDTYQRLIKILSTNVGFYGKAFFESENVDCGMSKEVLLDLKKLEEGFCTKNKLELMSMLKNCLNEKMRERSLTVELLNEVSKELLQGVYTYLGKKQMPISGLLTDANLNKLEQTATQSVTDMIKWVNYLLDVTFEYEERFKKSFTLSDKINQYISEHYNENIGRNTIAEELFLAPEYLSKVYKKETGKSINEVIANVRIAQAKILLERGESVSDVANKVGFDNFTYFSTSFKKITGISPTKYKKQ